MLQAQEAYAWFTGFTASGGESLLNDSEDSIMVGERQYNRVTLKSVQSGEPKNFFTKRNDCVVPPPPPIETMEVLERYLEGLFDAETVAALLATQAEPGQPLYLEQDGKLYRFGGYVGQLVYDTVQMSLTSREEAQSRIITARLQYSAWGQQYACSYDYELVKNDKGQWVFTNFQLPAALCMESAA